MAAYETLLLAVDDGVACLTLNRPEVLNAINHRMADELIDPLAAIEAHGRARVCA